MHISTSGSGKNPPKSVFLAAAIVIFFSSVSALGSIGFVPSYIDGTSGQSESEVRLSELPQLSPSTSSGQANEPLVVSGVEPERIRSAAIDLDVVVLNPETRDLKELDGWILKGAVRYVDSAKLGMPGNMLIFAHSSNYRVVRNQMYKAFNNISKLKPGDPISVIGGGVEYLYTVSSVRSAEASETTIDLSPIRGTRLTLTTCDVLSGKSARFIVEADFIGSVKLPQ